MTTVNMKHLTQGTLSQTHAKYRDFIRKAAKESPLPVPFALPPPVHLPLQPPLYYYLRQLALPDNNFAAYLACHAFSSIPLVTWFACNCLEPERMYWIFRIIRAAEYDEKPDPALKEPFNTWLQSVHNKSVAAAVHSLITNYLLGNPLLTQPVALSHYSTHLFDKAKVYEQDHFVTLWQHATLLSKWNHCTDSNFLQHVLIERSPRVNLPRIVTIAPALEQKEAIQLVVTREPIRVGPSIHGEYAIYQAVCETQATTLIQRRTYQWSKVDYIANNVEDYSPELWSETSFTLLVYERIA